MEDINEVYGKIDSLFSDNKINFMGYLQHVAQTNSSFYDMPDEIFEIYKNQFEKLKSEKEYYDQTKKHILTDQRRGKVLEKLVQCFYHGSSPIIDGVSNTKTRTNEIDILMYWSDFAKQYNINNIYEPAKIKGFIGECKNYKDSVSVTYVGKFYSLIKTCDFKVGILFSVNGISKAKIEKENGQGLVKKILLKENIYIIDFNYADFEMIYEHKANFFSIVKEKMKSMDLDADYSSFITNHDAEQELLQLIQERES